MPSLDNNVKWRRKRIWVDQRQMHRAAHAHPFTVVGGGADAAGTRINLSGANRVEASGAGGTSPQAALDGVVNLDAGSPGAGNPIEDTVTGEDWSGLRMQAAGDTARSMVMLPYDLDPRAAVGCRVHWTHGSATAADTIDWVVTYQQRREDEIIAAAATALNTVVAQDTVGAGLAHAWKRTARGIINANTLTFAGDNVTTLGLSMAIEMDGTAIDLAAEGVWLLGLELDYWPIYTQNSLDRRELNIYAA